MIRVKIFKVKNNKIAHESDLKNVIKQDVVYY